MTNYSTLKSTGAPGFPPGFIIPWANNTLPVGFLLCDGSNVSRTTYADLFAAIGTTYGTGDGSSTFGLPGLDGKSLLFQASGGNAGTGNVGGSAGNSTENVNPTNHVTLTNNQTATGAIVVSGNIVGHQLNISEIPAHTHNVNLIATDDGGITSNARFSRSDASTFNATVASDSTGGSGSHAHNHNIQVNSQAVNLSDAANTVVLGHNAFSVLSPSTRLRAVIKT
jgi:microcystin-dependent protein